MSGTLIEVGPEAAGERLDRFLAGPLGSRARAQEVIEAGRVLVDGRTRPKRHVLRGGERIEVGEGSSEPAPVPDDQATAPYDVRYEDEALLIVDKPPGVVVHPARGHRSGTLSQALAARGAAGGDPWRAGIVHRLDRDTSGLLVVAKREEAHAALKEQLARRELRREYLALVEGHPPARTGTIDAPIGRDRRSRVLMSIDTDQPREARTHYEIERLLPSASLLRVVLETGRTHQIRVHLAAIGFPVCGDPAYGTAGMYGLSRQFLHATLLRFRHPVSGEGVEVTSELPPDLVAALDLAAAGRPPSAAG